MFGNIDLASFCTTLFETSSRFFPPVALTFVTDDGDFTVVTVDMASTFFFYAFSCTPSPPPTFSPVKARGGGGGGRTGTTDLESPRFCMVIMK